MASLNTRQEDLVKNNPDVADIYWELQELKSQYADLKEELLQIRINDEVYPGSLFKPGDRKEELLKIRRQIKMMRRSGLI